MAWIWTRLEVPAITGDPSVLLAAPPPDDRWTPRPDRTVTDGQVLRWFDPGVSSSGTVERSGKLPVLRIGDIGLCASSRLASLGLRAICGLLFFAVGFLAGSTAFPQGYFCRERSSFGAGAALLPQRWPALEPGPKTGLLPSSLEMSERASPVWPVARRPKRTR